MGQQRLAQEAHVGPINAELFSREKGNVAMLLALLEDEPVGVNDFYVRYHTLQLLTALAVSSHRLLEVRTDCSFWPWPLFNVQGPHVICLTSMNCYSCQSFLRKKSS